MGYSIDAVTNDCYDGTTCLINKFQIKDEGLLSEIESRITFAKATELERNPVEGNFDFEHYKAIHRYLFDEIYEWAGTTRTINISKKGTQFIKVDEIDKIAIAIFKRLKEKNYFKNQSKNEFVDNIVDFYCATNSLHPFREGNGRAQRVFLSQLIRNAGYDIDFSNANTDELMIATIHAANGVTVYIKEIFEKIIYKQ